MKVTIIGCGYVGTAVARLWQGRDDVAVTATTTTPDRVLSLEAIASQVAIAKGNNAEALKSVLRDREVILLTVGARGGTYEETYLETARTLVSLLPEFPSIRQLIYTGSYAVYGDRGGEWVDESSPVAPANEKGEVLAETEGVLLAAARETLKVCVLRLGGIYGEGRELVRIFGRAAGMTRPGDGSDTSNWIHLDDIVGAIDFAVRHQLEGIYNLVDDSHLTTEKLIAGVLEANGLPPVTWDGSQSSSRSYNAKVSNQKLKDAGYQFIRPQIKF
ncbi:MAG: NAD-dependent epimerase/dehydratase family protein [Cyanobacteriota bacterium]|nr:NAD-dependent epimerase/dehydratase family protein [Cyanobacteriota bacterium]